MVILYNVIPPATSRNEIRRSQPRWRGFTIRAHTVKGKNLIKLDIVYLTLSQYIANMDEHGL